MDIEFKMLDSQNSCSLKQQGMSGVEARCLGCILGTYIKHVETNRFFASSASCMTSYIEN